MFEKDFKDFNSDLRTAFANYPRAGNYPRTITIRSATAKSFNISSPYTLILKDKGAVDIHVEIDDALPSGFNWILR